jgi:hypothetical protein
MGVGTVGFYGDLPLIIAFVILAAFTYTSGLRAPAMIAVVKDTLIYVTVLAMVIVIPIELGGYAVVCNDPVGKVLLTAPTNTNLGQFSAYATLALGSAFALFLYPHTVTGVLSSSSRKVISETPLFYRPIRSCSGFWPDWIYGVGDRRRQAAGVRSNLPSTSPTLRCRRSSCIPSPTGLRASPSLPLGSVA